MAKYRVLFQSKTFNKPGISPTVKNGTEMGFVGPNSIFTSLLPAGVFESNTEINGWRSIFSNKWIMASACALYTENPPPPLPEKIIMQSREAHSFNADGSPIWEPWEQWEKSTLS